MKFEYFIGRRYLKSTTRDGFVSFTTTSLSTLGVALGVMVLIVVIAVMTGFEEELKSRILGVEPHVLVMRYGEPMSDYEPIVERIKKLDNIKTVSTFIYAQAMFRSAKGVSGVMLRGIVPDEFGCGMKTTGDDCFSKMLTTPSSTPVPPRVILGKALAEDLNVRPGDIVHMITAQTGDGGTLSMPAVKRLKVAALFETGMLDYDGNIAFIHQNDAQSLFHMAGQVSGIGVRVDDIYAAGEISGQIVSFLDFPYWARDWMQMNKNLFSMLRLQKTVMFIILTLIVLVAASNIASALIMMVMEKTKEIAILKTMGAGNFSIRKIFVFKGMVIGTIGTVSGLILGFILCLILQRYQFIDLPGDVYFLTTLPVRLDIVDAIITISATLVICFVATLYPAGYAAKFDPVEGIRYG
ncbi:MAG: lipoprotein-releasing ABC transporter permease subunit [Desulfobacteraceae bacterium]|nr:lipoprotein-releasing ABC transporter permease subunit [Desulfobacteraceae bacterium]